MNTTRPTRHPPANPRRVLLINAALTVVVFAVIGSLFLVFLGKRTEIQRREKYVPPRPPTVPSAVTRPTSAPSTTTTTRSPAASVAGPPTDYAGLVASVVPSLSSTEPLSLPLDLREAAVIKPSCPIYICGRGDLWLTRADAPADTGKILRDAEATQAHLLRETPAFVWWRSVGDGGRWSPWLATKTTDGYEWVGPRSRVVMPTGETFDWSRAVFWHDDAVIVPTLHGVVIVRFGRDDKPVADSIDLVAPGVVAAHDNVVGLLAPQFVTDAEGVLAWAPPGEDGKPRGRGVARYVDGKWTMLDADQWPASTLHLVPLADGTIVRLTVEPPGGVGMNAKVRLSLVPLTTGKVDEGKIATLVEQLSDRDPRARQAAFLELTQFGPGAWPVLEKLRDEQPTEAQLRIGRLLRERTRPSLAGMSAVDDELRVVARDRAGGVVLYADKGVSVDDGTARATPQLVTPAWVALRPGRAAELLPATLVADLKPGRHRLDVVGQDWVVVDDVNGPRRYLGRKLVKLLSVEDSKVYRKVVGIDRLGRWVFLAGDKLAGSQTLILDPTLPDPTPRLPAWAITDATATGWTADGWPAVTNKGKDFELKESGWARLDPKKDKLALQLPPGPTTTPAVLWTAADGTNYLDGTTAIVIRDKAGQETSLRLPPDAIGQSPVHVAILPSGKTLLLMNTPGRVVRLKRGEDGQLAVEAVFTKKVPNGTVRRFWLDPAGRLCIAHDASGLTVMFPGGVIAPEIRRMMPVEELEAAE